MRVSLTIRIQVYISYYASVLVFCMMDIWIFSLAKICRYAISSGQTALPLKVDRRSLLHGGFVCESRYFRLDYKTQNVPSLQVRAVMEKCNRFFFFWVGFATQIFRAVHTRTTGSGTRARVVRTGFRPGSDTRVVVEAVKRGGGKLSVTIFCNNIWAF